MAVETLDETRRFPHVELLSALLESLMAELGLSAREVTLVLTDDEAIASLNARDRGVRGPTDVLSYPTYEPLEDAFPQVDHLGDIFISLDTAAVQAERAGHELLSEVAILAAHGLMHLSGLDHQDDEQWLPFNAAQRRIVELLNVEF